MKIEPKHQIALAQMGEAIEGKLKRVMTDQEKLIAQAAWGYGAVWSKGETMRDVTKVIDGFKKGG